MSEAASEGLLVMTTTPNEEAATTLARALVDESLAACVQVVPGLRSFFRWEGQVQDEPELLLLIKTAPDRREQVLERLGQLHPYTVPEAVTVRLDGGSPAYLGWLREVTR